MARGWLAVTLSVGAWAMLLTASAQRATFYGSCHFRQARQTTEASSSNFCGQLAMAHVPQLEPYTDGQATQPCPIIQWRYGSGQ